MAKAAGAMIQGETREFKCVQLNLFEGGPVRMGDSGLGRLGEGDEGKCLQMEPNAHKFARRRKRWEGTQALTNVFKRLQNDAKALQDEQVQTNVYHWEVWKENVFKGRHMRGKSHGQ